MTQSQEQYGAPPSQKSTPTHLIPLSNPPRLPNWVVEGLSQEGIVAVNEWERIAAKTAIDAYKHTGSYAQFSDIIYKAIAAVHQLTITDCKETIAEEISDYTVDMCENSQEFKNYILKLLK